MLVTLYFSNIKTATKIHTHTLSVANFVILNFTFTSPLACCGLRATSNREVPLSVNKQAPPKRTRLPRAAHLSSSRQSPQGGGHNSATANGKEQRTTLHRRTVPGCQSNQISWMELRVIYSKNFALKTLHTMDGLWMGCLELGKLASLLRALSRVLNLSAPQSRKGRHMYANVYVCVSVCFCVFKSISEGCKTLQHYTTGRAHVVFIGSESI